MESVPGMGAPGHIPEQAHFYVLAHVGDGDSQGGAVDGAANPVDQCHPESVIISHSDKGVAVQSSIRRR